jgi:hypothetical protein
MKIWEINFSDISEIASGNIIPLPNFEQKKAYNN